MKVFVTGATGFIGSATVEELIKAGHQVTGLARSDKAAQALAAAGARAHRGDVTDLASLRSGVAAADGVVHTAFIHDFSKFKENCEIDRRAVEAMGEALAGSKRPLVVTSGTGLLAPGRLAVEKDRQASGPNAVPRVATEEAVDKVAEKGVNVSVVRFPPSVHGRGDHGFVPMLIAMAREKGVSAYVGEGANRWAAVHRLDAGRAFRLALEKAAPGARYHAIGEEGIAFRQIAETIGKHLGLPVKGLAPDEAAAHFGWFAHFASLDAPASSKWTQETLGWRPTGPGLIADMEGAGLPAHELREAGYFGG